MELADITTKQDLLDLENRLIERLQEITSEHGHTAKKWLRSKEVQKLLGLSSSGLQNLRINGVLPYSKIQGSIYYDIEEIMRLLEKNKVDFTGTRG